MLEKVEGYSKYIYRKETEDYLIATAIGVIVGLLVVFFEGALNFFLELFEKINSGNRALIFFVIPFGMLLAYFIVIKIATIKKTGSGTHTILDSFYTHSGFIHPRDSVSKALAALVTIGSGGSSGPEGPSMVIGNGVASIISRKLGIAPYKLRRYSLAGASAGISAIFRAPLTGVLFAMEIPYRRDIESEAYIEAIVSSVVSYLVIALITGTENLFHHHLEGGVFNLISLSMILFAFLLGVLSSVSALLFTISNKFSNSFSKSIKVKIHPREYLLPIIGGLGISLIVFVNPAVAGPGHNIIGGILDNRAVGAAVFLLILKILATNLTVTFGGSGGMFVPSLAVGALTGLIFTTVFPVGNEELFIAMGMASVLAATNKTPLTAIALITETVGPGPVIPTIIATMSSYFFTGNSSFFEIQYPHRIMGEEFAMREIYNKTRIRNPKLIDDVKAIQIMTQKPVYFRDDETVDDAIDKVGQFLFRVYPIVKDERLIGCINAEDLFSLPEEDRKIKVSKFKRQPHFVRSNSTLKNIADKMIDYETDHVFVVEEGRRLIGIIADVDVIRALLDKSNF
jgi:CIC family chloride channel protein